MHAFSHWVTSPGAGAVHVHRDHHRPLLPSPPPLRAPRCAPIYTRGTRTGDGAAALGRGPRWSAPPGDSGRRQSGRLSELRISRQALRRLWPSGPSTSSSHTRRLTCEDPTQPAPRTAGSLVTQPGAPWTRRPKISSAALPSWALTGPQRPNREPPAPGRCGRHTARRAPHSAGSHTLHLLSV